MPSAIYTVSEETHKSNSPSAATRLGNLDPSGLELASRILDVIARYRLHRDASTTKSAHGTFGFLAQVYSKVAASQPILMCLPAFPFKSPNTSTKVLGRLPDKAEEFALAHLNGLCAAIKDIYPPGAKLMIISDGLVYNGIVPSISYFSPVPVPITKLTP